MGVVAAQAHDWIVTVQTIHYEEVRASTKEGAVKKAQDFCRGSSVSRRITIRKVERA